MPAVTRRNKRQADPKDDHEESNNAATLTQLLAMLTTLVEKQPPKQSPDEKTHTHVVRADVHREEQPSSPVQMDSDDGSSSPVIVSRNLNTTRTDRRRPREDTESSLHQTNGGPSYRLPSRVEHRRRAHFTAAVSFSGGPRESLEAFLARFFKHAKALQYCNQDCLEVLPTLLNGCAESWHQQAEQEMPFSTWGELLSALHQRFGANQLRASAVERELEDCLQNPGETVMAYYDRVVELVKLLTMAPRDEVKAFLRGLDHRVRFFVEGQHPRTLDEALTHAMDIDSRLPSTGILPDPTRPTTPKKQPQLHAVSDPKADRISALEKELKDLKEAMSKVQESSSAPPRRSHPYPRQDRKQMSCHHCGRKGHLQKDCRQKLYCEKCRRKGHKTEECNRPYCENCKMAGHTQDRCRRAKCSPTKPQGN